ncbi:MAG TPA: DUF1569 domain-containing protein [Thermoanaerobaculia bacterium]|jgi:hypothetical protein|nr:DUF1569 domain-containing protein [Thermoanaerobaculia bacterium]
MQNLFDLPTRQALLERLDRLRSDSPRQWGKMDAGQMLAHCATALEMSTGDQPRKQKLIGRLLGPLVRKKLLGEAPFPRNSPTDPAFVYTDARDFAAEKARLQAVIERFAARGPERAAEATHSFLGRLDGEEWGCMMAKHLDHHLRQFGL